ncbi:hypothetical protein BC834DRAFT_49889 [Gloeopeniophorella convolvens]|nr:hypothetical protein BC834DRAFT_49889 [Gloeopeniophorella convolvens]
MDIRPCTANDGDALVLADLTTFVELFLPDVMEVVCFGAFTFLVGLTPFILFREGPWRKYMSAAMLAVISVMFTSSVIHFIEAEQAFDLDARLGSETLLYFFSFSSVQSTRVSASAERGVFVKGAASLINILLSDAVVMWRAWVIWSRSRTVLAISGALSLTTLAVGIVNLRFGKGIGSSGSLGDTLLDTNEIATLTALFLSVLSLVSNLWSFGLIAWKAWYHRRRIRHLLSLGTKQQTVGQALALLLESGALYSLLWMLLLLSNVFPLEAANNVNSVFSNIIVHVSGIYPTVILVIVCIRKNLFEASPLDEDLSPHLETAPQQESLAAFIENLTPQGYEVREAPGAHPSGT